MFHEFIPSNPLKNRVQPLLFDQTWDKIVVISGLYF